MIGFENVSVRYRGSKRPAVDSVSFDAKRGAITVVAGPNGSGKSTLVRALLGRERVEHGRIMIGGEDRASLRQIEFARIVAVVPQREDTLFPLYVREYVRLGRYPHSRGLAESPTDSAAVASAVERAEIDHLVDRRTDELSGGEWQRVRVARALAQSAEALVMDEPTTFLDIAHEMSLLELMHTLAQGGMAILLVSHQLNLVSRFADRMVLLDRGRVAASGTPSDVMNADVLQRVYEWPMVVTHDNADRAPALFPLRKPHQSS